MSNNKKKLATGIVAKIIREEAKKLLSEQPVGKKNSFEAWALKKLKDEFGTSVPPTVNVGNVVSFLQGSKFKLSPEEFEARKNINTSYQSLLNQFKNRDSGKAIPSDEEEQVPGEDEDGSGEAELPTSKLTYRSGDVPLEDIARELGGITKMGVSKKIDDSLRKVKDLGAGGDDPGAMLAKIDAARQQGALDYVNLLAASRGNVNAFLKALEASKLVKLANDVGVVTDNEKKAIKALADTIKTHGKDVAMEMLISDAEDNDPTDRIWKTYQAVVARKASPRRKRGAGQADED